MAFPTGYANVRGRIDQVSVMANVLYDFFPGAMVTPYIGGGAGVAFVDANTLSLLESHLPYSQEGFSREATGAAGLGCLLGFTPDASAGWTTRYHGVALA